MARRLRPEEQRVATGQGGSEAWEEVLLSQKLHRWTVGLIWGAGAVLGYSSPQA